MVLAAQSATTTPFFIATAVSEEKVCLTRACRGWRQARRYRPWRNVGRGTRGFESRVATSQLRVSAT